MALTLDDIIAAPSDLDSLRTHLVNNGIVPKPTPPPAAPAAPTIPAISPITTPHPGAPLGPENAEGFRTPRPTAAMVAASGAPSTAHTPGIPNMSVPEIGAPALAPENTSGLKVPASIGPVAPTKKESQEAGKAEYAAMRPQITAQPGSSEYFQQKINQEKFDDAHPWGADISAHPGVLGKIGHIAGRIGNIAGDIVAPGTTALIPGTQLNKNVQERSDVAELGKAKEAESKLATEQGARENVASEVKAREQKTEQEGEKNEQSLEKDPAGNVTGWKDKTGEIHSIDDPETPQSIKDMAAASQQAPKFERDERSGNIVKLTTDKDGTTHSEVVYQGTPNQKTETRSLVGPDGKPHDQVIDITPGSPTFGKSLADLGQSKVDKQPSVANELAKQKFGEDVVLAYDKNNHPHIMSRDDAKEAGYDHVTKAQPGDIDKAMTHHTVLNTLQTQLNSVVDASDALAQGKVQKGIIFEALSHPSNTTIDNAIRATVLSGATEKTQNYVQAVIALREAGLALPKEITGGSRVSEVQASALWQSMPGATSINPAYAIKQAKKFQQDIDRLRERAPDVRGITDVEADQRIKSTEKRVGEKTPAAGAALPAPEGKVSVYDPDGVQHFVNAASVDKFLADPKYKGYTKNAPNR